MIDFELNWCIDHLYAKYITFLDITVLTAYSITVFQNQKNIKLRFVNSLQNLDYYKLYINIYI